MNRALFKLILQEQRRPLILLLILVIFSASLCGYLTLYQTQQHSQLMSLWQSEYRRLHDPQQMLGIQIYRGNQAALQRLWSKIPPHSEFPRLLGSITDEAALHDTTLKGFVYTGLPRSTEGLAAYQLQITAEGSYGGVKQFLSALYSLSLLSTIESVVIKRTETPPWQVRMEIRMTLRLRQESES